MVFPTLKFVFFPKNVHLCVMNFSFKNICLWYQWTKMVFLNLKCVLPEEYTPLYKLTKWCFLHWKIFETSVIYIYSCAIIHLCDFFHLKYIHLCTIIQLCDFSSLEVYTPPYDYTPLSFFLPKVYTLLCDYTPLWFFHLKYIHLCVIADFCDFS